MATCPVALIIHFFLFSLLSSSSSPSRKTLQPFSTQLPSTWVPLHSHWI
ncbi:hypothetical protein GLYMA_07G257450v4 [Glycine max]|nr:hypothetical protein GLYMA_07G257450v4 [Glycine max]KAH1088641.1 hypothetical protein GYH30_019595 [Glycine max]